MSLQPPRKVVPPQRLTYSGQGKQSETTRPLGMSAVNRNKFNMDQDTIIAHLARERKIVEISEQRLKDTQDMANKYENRDESSMTEDEWKSWLEVRRERHNCNHCLAMSRERIRKLEATQKLLVGVAGDAEAAKPSTSVKGHEQTKKGGSVTSSLPTRLRALELQARLEQQKVQQKFRKEISAVADEIEDMEQELQEAEEGNDKNAMNKKLAFLKTKHSRLQRDQDLELNEITEKEMLQREIAEEEFGDEQDLSNYDNKSVDPTMKWLHDEQIRTQDYDDHSQPKTPPVYEDDHSQYYQDDHSQYYHDDNQQYYHDPVADLANVMKTVLLESKGGNSWNPGDLPIFGGAATDWPIFYNEFYRTTPKGKVNSSQNAIRLRKALKGSARDAVVGLLNEPRNVTKVMDILKKVFGRSELVIENLIEKAERTPSPKLEKPETLVTFATTVLHLVETVRSLHEDGYLNDKTLLIKLVNKLPAMYGMEWKGFILSHHDLAENLGSFADWLEVKMVVAASLSKPTVVEPFKKEDGKGKRGSAIHVSNSEPKEESTQTSCICCGKRNHKLKNCFKFKKENIADKIKLVKEKGFCFCCLEGGHLLKDCPHSKECGQDECKRRHHPLLHSSEKSWKEKRQVNKNTEKSENNSEKDDCTGDTTNIVVTKTASSKPLSVCRVKISGPEGTRKCYALLDSGADTTIIDSSLAKDIGLTGQKIEHKCSGIGGSKLEEIAERVNFKIVGCYNKAPEYNVIGAMTMENLGISPYSQNASDAKMKWPHLRKARLENFNNIIPRIIIGEDHPYLSAHRRICEDGVHNPMAKRTVLGWVMAGQKLAQKGSNTKVNHIHVNDEDNLDTLMKSFFSLDTYGVYPLTTVGSMEDRRALAILEKTVRKDNEKWECGLLWRSESVKFPESKKEAFSRLMSIEKRMKKDNEFCQMYNAKIDEYKEKGYIKELTEKESKQTTDRTLYIPHFAVFNINKPGKLRLVFDAACKTGGVSLNNHLLVGPDLIRPLNAVLMNFRIYNVAITGDIEDMFHRVGVRKDDQDSQRFLWRDWRNSDNPRLQEFVMKVLIFGACSSPSSAIYVKNKIADEFASTHPEVSRIIKEEFYSDDCLTGSQTVEGAIKLLKDICEINAAGNFHVKKWLSNSKEVLASIPESHRAAGVKHFSEKSEIPSERVLGVWWNPEEDCFTFTTNFKKVDPALLQGMRPTKREASRLLMSIFDPLGFIAHYKIKGVIILQRIWRSGVDWDEKISDEIFLDWTTWLENLKNVSNVKLPRSYCMHIHLATEIELHTIVDSSEEATACICYLRIKTGENVSVSFVAAKTKVAPTKKLTIPRLELLAAVLGVCLAETVTHEINLKINKRYFWSDSKTVLLWIRSEVLRYNEYVANRVNRIHLLSNVSEWQWIPSALNTADHGTRLKSEVDLTPNSDWLCGPLFLMEEQGKWPIERKPDKCDEVDAEVKKSKIFKIQQHEHKNAAVVKMERFSSFNRMLRVQAAVILCATYWLKRTRPSQKPWKIKAGAKVSVSNGKTPKAKSKKLFAKFLRENVTTKMDPETLEKAEMLLIKKAQEDAFGDENGKVDLGKRGRLWKLSPYLSNGIVRMKGRISAAALPESTKDPIILAARHVFTELLIQSEHVRNAHQGQMTVLSNLRKKYWIIEGKSAVRRLCWRCQVCKLGRVKPIVPKMGELPLYRLSIGNPPFHYTGVDLFGPVEVVVGRHHEKRWISVFTCMVTRSIHLEVVHGLSTDETMMAISRFVDQRGRPRHIYSDNGTNFVGAAKDLKVIWDSVDWDKIMNMERFHKITWHFIPPYSPHFGGAWERMVQTVKKALRKTLKEKCPRDQTLLTMLKGVENIVNSRPITYVSGDAADPEALTPNHFLRGFADLGPSLPGEYEKADEVLRAQWRQSQYFLDQFWKQWTREALPELARRTKWHEDVEPICVGDLVFVVDENVPRNTWMRGIVSDVFPGKDGLVRAVDVEVAVKDGKKVYRRGVDKLCPLGLAMGKSGQLP